jgi:flagellar biosynthesis/type III secretory pathway protein FliH
MLYDFKDLYVVRNNYIANPFNDIKKIFTDYDIAAAYAEQLNYEAKTEWKHKNPDKDFPDVRIYRVIEFEETIDSIIESEREDAYDNGYQEGAREGRDSGYDDGWEDGKKEGYDEGYEDGKRESGSE